MSEQESGAERSRLSARHPRGVAYVRIGVGVWLLVLMGIFYGLGHGGYWAWLYAVGAALLFYIAYRDLRAARSGGGPEGR